MFTIYTFGDPDIVIEALLALATIFNASAWVDGGSAFGLGGNLLAAALIGLLAVLVGGLNQQNIRLDYLLTAFIIFAVTFAVKIDVNVEDVQTGAARVVPDVPIGIALVASASSSIAWSITETAETALQRPGSPTATISTGGFLYPLKTLIAIRNMQLEDLSGPVHRSLLEYYKNCVGKTLENNPGVFDMDEFLNTPNPLDYLLDVANIEDYATIYYTVAIPNGVGQGCEATAAALLVDIGDIIGNTNDELERWIRRQLGTREFDNEFTATDIDDAVDTLFRAGFTGAEYLEAQFVRNLHNAGEAWRTAEYGTDKAQYVATLTQAFEEQRAQDAAKGSAFLQNMVPLMSFFQFLFFLLAPFVAFLAIAVPQSTLKTVGFYLLLGAWAYSWMPIATVINHYTQIQVQNTLEFADTAVVGTGFTAILGFDSLYNILATKVAIGSTALAWTPIITGAILALSLYGISQQVKAAGNINAKTDTLAPDLVKNGPILQRAALASASVGTALSAGGMFAQESLQQREGFGDLRLSRNLSWVGSTAASHVRAAQQERSQLGSSLSRRMQSIANESELSASQRTSWRDAINTSIGQVAAEQNMASQWKALNAGEQAAVRTELGLGMFRAGASQSRGTTANLTENAQDMVSALKGRRSEIMASAVTGVEDTGSRSTETEAALRREAGHIQQLSESIKANKALQDEVKSALSDSSGVGFDQSINIAEMSKLSLMHNKSAVAMFDQGVRDAGGEALLSNLKAQAATTSDAVSAAGITGNYDPDNAINQLASRFYALQDMARTDPRAMEALLRNVQDVGGKATGVDLGINRQALNRISELGQMSLPDTGDAGTAFGASRRTAEAVGLSEGDVAADAARVSDVASRIDSAAGERQSRQDIADQMRDAATYNRALDLSGYGRAANMVDAKIAGARTAMDDTAVAQMHDFLRGDAGFNSETLPALGTIKSGFGANEAETAERVAAGARAVATLEGAMSGQLGVSDVRPTDVYRGLIDQGMTPLMAAQGAYAAAAYQYPGKAELLFAATLGGKGAYQAGKRMEGSIIAKAGDDAAARAAASKSSMARAARLVKVGGPALAAVSVGVGYYMADSAAKRSAAEADEAIKYDFLEGVTEQGDRDAFNAYLRQNEMSEGGLNATQLINEYARFNNQVLPFGNAAGRQEGAPSVSMQDVQFQRDEISKDVER